MSTVTERMTADRFLAIGDELPRFSQLIDGEVVVNEPSARHQDLAGYLYRGLADWADRQPGRGKAFLPLDVRLAEHQVYAPDVLWLAESHLPPRDAAHLVGPPDLVVEVRSASTWRYDLGTKKAVYERRGLPELWLVDSAADTVLVYRRSHPDAEEFDVALEVGASQTLASPLLPGFAVDVSELFDR
jgi:Uma2 family endonuclease